MATISARSYSSPATPVIRAIDPQSLKTCLERGWRDFCAHPTHPVFLSVIYPMIGIILVAATGSTEDLFILVYPLISGFALLGPLAAVGLYEISRRAEGGVEIAPGDALAVLRAPGIGSVLVIGLLLAGLFAIWLGAATVIYASTLGPLNPKTPAELLRLAVTTNEGWRLMLIGNFVGLLFAVLAFTISVVSIPMLIDRDVGVATAIETSIRAVAANPLTMALWGLIVAVALALASIPFLVGLVVVLPVLGHATWHLYRQVVAPPIGKPFA